MDKKLLRSLLEEVAVIKDVGIDIGPNGRELLPSHKIKTIKEIQTIINEFGEEIEEEIEIPIHNPTVPYILGELKPKYRACELGCGKIIADQIIQKRKYQQPVPHWRTLCTTCVRGLSPDGTHMIRNGTPLNQAYLQWFNNKQDK